MSMRLKLLFRAFTWEGLFLYEWFETGASPVPVPFHKRYSIASVTTVPRVTIAYGTLVLVAMFSMMMGLYDLERLALDYTRVLRYIEVWRLVTSFLCLGRFSLSFLLRLLIVAKCGSELETGPFRYRVADFLWMWLSGVAILLILGVIRAYESSFLGVSLVFMILWVWSGKTPKTKYFTYGPVELNESTVIWVILALDVAFGRHIILGLMGFIAGFLYSISTGEHSFCYRRTIFGFSRRRTIFGRPMRIATPMVVHDLVAWWS